MCFDAKGFFVNGVTDKIRKKEELVEAEGWVQIVSGFWAEKWRIDKGEKPERICRDIDSAFKTARSSKTGEKRQPPDPIWLDPGYLPGLEEAKNFDIPLLSDDDLVQLSTDTILKQSPHKLIFDIECYGNYFLIAFMSLEFEKVTFLELSHSTPLDTPKLKWILNNFCIIGFNSIKYDIIITALAVHGCTTAMMKSATTAIIEHKTRGCSILRNYKIKALKLNHIDIIEVAPLSSNLKIYGGRLHTKRLQDLPFHHDTVLSEDQIDIVRWYCVNDLRVTKELYKAVEKDIILRESIGKQYKSDLRSKSDAQIAEAVIVNEMTRLNGYRPRSPIIEPGTSYNYVAPDFIKFNTSLMKSILTTIRQTPFVVSEHGNVGLPQTLKDLKILINQTTYTLGIGGLHSKEKSASHYATPTVILKDVDVVSYYPLIILILKLYPHQLGDGFLGVYGIQVAERIAAKQRGDKREAATRKIVVNGAFGKLGSKYSILYAPDLLIQVTITGQLALLMLIERLELADIPVVSANTDGVIIKCPKIQEIQMNTIIQSWQQSIGFETTEIRYAAIFSRDVNNYLAIKDPSTWVSDDNSRDKVKTKGIFAEPGLSKNPQNRICIDAITELLLNGIPISQTICSCRDITKFVNIRTVKGGAVKLDKNGEVEIYLGKSIRWYYAKDEMGKIVYAKNGNKVPKSQGARPIMDLPNQFPEDIDYDWYEKETAEILKGIDCYG